LEQSNIVSELDSLTSGAVAGRQASGTQARAVLCGLAAALSTAPNVGPVSTATRVRMRRRIMRPARRRRSRRRKSSKACQRSTLRLVSTRSDMLNRKPGSKAQAVHCEEKDPDRPRNALIEIRRAQGCRETRRCRSAAEAAKNPHRRRPNHPTAVLRRILRWSRMGGSVVGGWRGCRKAGGRGILGFTSARAAPGALAAEAWLWHGHAFRFGRLWPGSYQTAVSIRGARLRTAGRSRVSRPSGSREALASSAEWKAPGCPSPYSSIDCPTPPMRLHCRSSCSTSVAFTSLSSLSSPETRLLHGRCR